MSSVSIEPEFRFIQDMVEEGRLDNEDDRTIPSGVLFTSFKAYCETNNISMKGRTKDTLGKTLRRAITIDSKVVKLDGKCVRCHVFCPKDTMQQALQSRHKWTV